MQERAERSDDTVRALVALPPGKFVRPAGLDFEAGWKGLTAGHLLDARALGLAAAMGHAWLPVRRRPRVAILATGDELVWPGETPKAAQIVSSNNPTLAAMVAGWGGEPIDLGIARDHPEDLVRAFDQAREVDFVVTSGGASVGAYDLVQETLVARGLAVSFWKIAMRPGKPLIFGRLGEIPFIGLPGNPVSAGVCALVYLRAALLRSLGRPTDLPVGRAPLAAPLAANDEREEYMRGTWKRDRDGRLLAQPAARQDSSMFATFAHADLLIRRPPHDPARAIGEEVEIIEIARALAI
jgi:Molybdopterin biosynthesis enzyme